MLLITNRQIKYDFEIISLDLDFFNIQTKRDMFTKKTVLRKLKSFELHGKYLKLKKKLTLSVVEDCEFQIKTYFIVCVCFFICRLGPSSAYGNRTCYRGNFSQEAPRKYVSEQKRL